MAEKRSTDSTTHFKNKEQLPIQGKPKVGDLKSKCQTERNNVHRDGLNRNLPFNYANGSVKHNTVGTVGGKKRTDNKDVAENKIKIGKEKDQKHRKAETQPEEIENLSPPSPPQLQSDSPKKSNTDASEIWTNIIALGKPRFVISMIGAFNALIPSYTRENQLLLEESLTHVARFSESCGFLFKPEDFNLALKIIRTSFCVGCLPHLIYGYTSTRSTAVPSLTSRKEETQENNNKEDLMKLLEIEIYINSRMDVTEKSGSVSKESNMNIPVVLLVVNGGFEALEHVVRSIYRKIPVVVVKGTGGTADLIALCLKDKDKVKKKLPAMFARRFNNETWEKMEEIISSIVQIDWMITVFDIKKKKKEELLENLIDGIMRAWAFQEHLKRCTEDKRINVDKICNNVDEIKRLPQKELFDDSDIQTESYDVTIEIQKDFVEAFVTKRTDIIQQILLSYQEFTLNEVQMKSFCQQVLMSKMSQAGFKLLQIVHPEGALYLTVDNGKSFNNTNEAINSILKKLLQGLWCSKLGCVKCCRYCKPDTVSKHNTLFDILNVALMVNDIERAAEIWRNIENPMLTALVANAYLNAMADVAENLFEAGLRARLLAHSRLFLTRAVQLLENIFAFDEQMAVFALDYGFDVGGHQENPLHFAHQFHIEEFISHSSNQKDASRRLFSLDESIVTLNTYPINSFGWFLFIGHHWKNSKTKIFTAPVTKIFFHVVFFLTALIMFSLFLIHNLRADSISLMEVLVFIYMLGDLFEEIWSMIRPLKYWSPQRIILHLFDIWNILDFLCLILYIVAFSIRISNPDLLVHCRGIYSIALFIMFLRLLNLLLLFQRLGIIIIMVIEMLVDLLEYLVILIILMCAAGVVYYANIYPNHTVTDSSDIDFWRIWTILKIPYWQVYGELYLNTLEASDVSGCTDNATIWKNYPSVERCPTDDWITPVIAAFYMMLTNWLLLNIVIAMFSARFENIQKKSREKWLYFRHLVILDYEERIPSPLNLLLRIYVIIRHAAKRCGCCRPCLQGGNENTQKEEKINEMKKKQSEFANKIIDEEKHQKTI